MKHLLRLPTGRQVITLQGSVRCFLLLSLLLFFTQKILVAANPFPEKFITLIVNQTGIVSDGRDVISSDDIANYIRQRLFKSYTGNGKMYDAIKLIKEGEPEPVVLEVIQKEIARGQKKALTELSLEKYKNVFENLNIRQQEKLKKNFKVLFQTTYD